MRNTNLVPIDVSLVQKLIATQFPQWAELSIKPVEFSGWDNRTFYLGEHMTVRLPSDEKYSLQVEKEQFWLPRLAPQLPLPIPTPLAIGKPGEGYLCHWSVYSWIAGHTASMEHIADLCQFATSLAKFLEALQRCDATGGPLAGQQNFYRGGDLANYDAETRQAIAILGNKIDVDTVTEVWNTALTSTWNKSPVWVHGDIAIGNLLVDKGNLCAVIDFGQLCIGDPACDLSIAWTFFTEESRNAFRAAILLDNATWERARGWTLWKALIVYAGLPGTNLLEVKKSKQIIDDLLADHKRFQ